MMAFLVRYMRITKIFEAQQIYFENNQRPSDMIKQYSELRLAKLVATVSCLIAVVYFTVGGIFWKEHYGVLPTIALGKNI